MDANYFVNPFIFLIDSLASLYILAVLLRLLLQWCGASFYNPASQFLLKITHPPLRILRQWIPPLGRIDSSSLVLAMLLQTVTNVFILMLKWMSVKLGALVILSTVDLLNLTLDIFIFSVFVQAILSVLPVDNYQSFSTLLTNLTAPLLNPLRKFIPEIAGFDLSPLAALLLLQLAKMILVPPLQQLATIIS